MNPWLTVSDLAAEWQTSCDHVRNLIATGQLPATNIAIKPGARRPQWRIRREDVDQFRRRRAAVPCGSESPKRTRRSQARQWV